MIFINYSVRMCVCAYFKDFKLIITLVIITRRDLYRMTTRVYSNSNNGLTEAYKDDFN